MTHDTPAEADANDPTSTAERPARRARRSAVDETLREAMAAGMRFPLTPPNKVEAARKQQAAIDAARTAGVRVVTVNARRP